MSRNLTTNFKNAISAQVVRPLILITAEFDTETIRFFNGVGEFVYDGDTYTGSGLLLKVSEIVETQNIEARGASFELSGIPSSLISVVLAEEYQDRRITMLFVALDEDNNVISDPFMFFSGKADVMSIDDGATNSTIKLTAESDLISLARVNERRRTAEDQKLTYTGDTFFDQVPSLQSKDIVWGKNG